MFDDRLQEAANRAEETEAAKVGSDLTDREAARRRSAPKRFRVIFRRALFLMALFGVVLLAGIVGLILAASSSPFSWPWLIVWGAMVIAVNIAWFVNWRCPVCGEYLGGGYWGMFSVRHCLNCGADLE
jgi:hypothetical protein